MTLPASPNSISLGQVNTELNLTSTTQISLNNTNVRTLFEVPSGAISMSNGWSKSYDSFTETFSTFPTSYSGNFAIFSAASNTLTIAASTSTYRVNRSITTNTNTRGFSAEFQLTSLNTDDAGSVMFTIGTFTAGGQPASYAIAFNPRRESAYDSVRRPEIYINTNTESPLMGSAALAINTWYKLVVNILPGTNASNAKIYNVSTSALVSSVTFTGSYSPFSITGFDFSNNASAGLTSSATQYRNVTVSSFNLSV